MNKKILFLCAMLMSPAMIRGEEIFGFNLGRTEILLEIIGLNYLPLSINIPLTKDPVPLLKPNKERDIYGHLLTRVPRFIILEASAYPLPLVGVGIHYLLPEFYDAMELWTNFNLIRSITVSFFEEPWAVSLFFGNVVAFDPYGESRDMSSVVQNISLSNDAVVTNQVKKEIKGRGYSGLLFSYGNSHIKHNLLYPDDWLETELKLIGKYSSHDQEISWSYRLGAKFNWNTEIDTYVYLALKRDRLDKEHYYFSLIENSMVEFEVSFDVDSVNFHKVTLVLGKKFPSRKSKVIPELNLGFTWKFNPLYHGSLQDPGDTGFDFVISPNVRF